MYYELTVHYHGLRAETFTILDPTDQLGLSAIQEIGRALSRFLNVQLEDNSDLPPKSPRTLFDIL